MIYGNYTITEDGLSQVGSYGVGGLYLWDARNFHRLNRSQSFYSESNLNKTSTDETFYEQVKNTITSKTLTELASGVKVTHTHQNNLTVEYTYTYDTTLNIQVKIINDSDTYQLTCPALGGLRLNFPQTPSGIAPQFNKDNSKLHPSESTQIYGGYLMCSGFGFSLTPIGVKNERCLTHFSNDGTYRWPEFHLRRFVWPRSTEVFNISIHTMSNPTQSGLMVKYKDDFLTQYGPKQYTIGNRKWIYGTSTSGNPLTPSNYLTQMSGIKSALNNGRGVVLYELSTSSRGPVPYEMWPRTVEDCMWSYNVNLLSGGLTPGLLTEFHLQPVRKSWSRDEHIALWPVQEPTPDILVQASNWNLIEYKFNRVNDYEFGIYYSPSGGSSYESALTIQKIRPLTTASIYAGYNCDMISHVCGFVNPTPEFLSLMKYVHTDVDAYYKPNVSSSGEMVYAFTNRMGYWTQNSGDRTLLNQIQPSYINSSGAFI